MQRERMRHEVLRSPPKLLNKYNIFSVFFLGWLKEMNETQGSRRETTSLKRIAVHVVFWKDARVQESGLVVKVDLRRQMTLNLACFPSFRFSMCWEDWNGVVKMSKLLSVPEHPVCVGFLTWFCHSSTYPLGYCWVLTWPDSISFQSDAAASVYPKAARETNWSSEARARDWGGKKKKKKGRIKHV